MTKATVIIVTLRTSCSVAMIRGKRQPRHVRPSFSPSLLSLPDPSIPILVLHALPWAPASLRFSLSLPMARPPGGSLQPESDSAAIWNQTVWTNMENIWSRFLELLSAPHIERAGESGGMQRGTLTHNRSVIRKQFLQRNRNFPALIREKRGGYWREPTGMKVARGQQAAIQTCGQLWAAKSLHTTRLILTLEKVTWFTRIKY